MGLDDHWKRLERGWVKLNTDGAFSKVFNSASIGGLFRDHNDAWLSGFSMRVGQDSIFRTEVRAILEGLKLAWSLGYKQLLLECDNALAIEIILVGGIDPSMLVELRLIKQLLIRDWSVRLRYIPRAHNKTVDWMVKLRQCDYDDLHIFKDCPRHMQDIIMEDIQLSTTFTS